MTDKIKVAEEAKDLKRGVDHIGISASFVVHDGKGNILLQKRGQNARDEQRRWDVGGGAIEFGESIDEAVKREIKEELCCDTQEIDFLTVYDAHREHKGAKTHWIAIIHAVKVDPKKVKIGEPDKIEELGWFTSKNLPNPLHSQFEKSFRIAKEQGYVT